MSLLSETVSTVIEAKDVNIQNQIPSRLTGTMSVSRAIFTAGAGVGKVNQVIKVPLSHPIPALSFIVKVIIDTIEPFTSTPGVADLGLGFNEPNDYLNIGVDMTPWAYTYNWVGYNDPKTVESTLSSIQLLSTNATLTGGQTIITVLFM